MKPYFEYLHIKNLFLPNINPVMGGIQQCSSKYTFGPVMREYYILFYVISGKGTYTVNGISYNINKGNCFIIRPYEVHILQADEKEPWEHLWIGFETTIELPSLINDKYVFDLNEYEDTILRFIEIHRSGGDSVDYSSNLFTLFTKIHASEQRNRESENIIDKAVEIIKKEYATITVQALAKKFYLNRSYFGSLFKKKTGKSPKQHIDEIRLSAASKLIHEFGYNVTQAAYAVGYSDRTVFSKMYKKKYGVSPQNSTYNKKGRTIIL